MAKKCELAVTLHWHWIESDDDARWRHDLALYAYLPPFKSAIYYFGKCDRTTVRGRASYSAKSGEWNCINRLSKTHRVIMAEVEVEHRLTRALLADIESLLIFLIQPCCNVQNTQSRGRHSRPGMKVECKGDAWPLSKHIYWEVDDEDS